MDLEGVGGGLDFFFFWKIEIFFGFFWKIFSLEKEDGWIRREKFLCKDG